MSSSMLSVAERAEIEATYLKENGLKSMINCLSGGIDSSVSGIISSKATKNAIGLLLPCSSKEEMTGERLKDIEDAKRVADHAHIPHVVVNLCDLWMSVCELYVEKAREMSQKSGIVLDESKLKWAKNNLKPTLRMMTAGFFADAFQGLMIGTDNAIENFLGYFSVRGDGIADRQPIRDCTKKEVRELAASCDLANDLINRIPTAGLWPGQTDEDELGFSYNDADLFFLWILNLHLKEKVVLDEYMTVIKSCVQFIVEHSKLPVSQDVANKIISQNRRTAFKRKADDLKVVLTKRGMI